jgi:prepilin-type N-terminal cleavage/methylation domain-containing protein
MRAHRGYSFLELMVGLTVFGILAAVSAPSICSYLRSRGARSGADQVVAHLRMARSNAIMEGNDYLVQFIDATTYVVIDDDGGGDGLPGSPDFVATNRGNGAADFGERVFGPYELPPGLAFDTSPASTNPFTQEPLGSSVTFPPLAGVPTVVFHPNGTANANGYVAMAPHADVSEDSAARTMVLRVLRPTGNVEARPAGA